jgi:large subunit ribosomal protein L30
MSAKLKITWKKSAIGYEQTHKDTVRSLGLKRLHHSVVHEDSPVVRGMIHKVKHLVTVEPVTEQE